MQGWGCSLHTLTCLLRKRHAERCSDPADPSPTSAKQRRAARAPHASATRALLLQGHADQCKVMLVFLLPQPRAVRPPHAEHQSDGREKKGPALPTATKQRKTQTQS